MRTTFNSSFMQSRADLARTTADLADAQREVSSGRRVNSASDDPSAASALVRERTEMAALDQYSRTSDSATSRLAMADSVLTDIIDRLTAAKVAVLGARSSPVGDPERTAKVNELAAIRDELFGAFSITFNGSYLFSGTAATTAPYQKLAGGGVSAYQGTTATMAVDIDRQVAVDVTFDASSIAQGSDAADIFTVLDQAMTAVAAGDGAGMDAAMAALGRAFDRATTAQSQVGASQRAIETQQARLSDLKRASVARASSLEDANMADAITRMTQADTAYRAALGAIGAKGRQTLMDYL
jgi:flagellar hook-associated protein 3 FlgL